MLGQEAGHAQDNAALVEAGQGQDVFGVRHRTVLVVDGVGGALSHELYSRRVRL
jgi:hypothetical protein